MKSSVCFGLLVGQQKISEDVFHLFIFFRSFYILLLITNKTIFYCSSSHEYLMDTEHVQLSTKMRGSEVSVSSSIIILKTFSFILCFEIYDPDEAFNWATLVIEHLDGRNCDTDMTLLWPNTPELLCLMSRCRLFRTLSTSLHWSDLCAESVRSKCLVWIVCRFVQLW